MLRPIVRSNCDRPPVGDLDNVPILFYFILMPSIDSHRPSGKALAGTALALGFAAGLAAGAALTAGAEPGRAAEPARAETPAAPAPTPAYPAEVLRVIDGDTFEARLRVWPGLEVVTKVRLAGIDAPELSARCAREHALAAQARDRPSLPSMIPGGSPRNPMGAAALTLSGGGQYAIHGTNVPGSIGGFVSYGCIRMLNEDVLDLYGRVGVGTAVVVTR